MNREDIRMKNMNMELLLINSLKINAFKVQTVIENFIKNKSHTCLFCLTETKVDSLDFNPQGIKIFTKHRKSTEKKGGGLIIGYKDDRDIKLEEIEVEDNDILALEGVIRGEKSRIILSYFDSSKSHTDDGFKKNREIQKKVEGLMEVEPETALISLGDMNGRLTRLEPKIVTDVNGKMLEEWVTKFDMHHLNLTEQCTGTYTFKSENGRSAIDHILVNDWL